MTNDKPNLTPAGLLIDVIYQEGDDLFICAVWGRTTVDELNRIEDQMRDEAPEFMSSDGDYRIRVKYEREHVGPDGRVELPGYWDLELETFNPIETP